MEEVSNDVVVFVVDVDGVGICPRAPERLTILNQYISYYHYLQCAFKV